MGAGVNRVATVAMVSVVLLGTSALGYGVARAASEYGEAGPVRSPSRGAGRGRLEPDHGTDRDPAGNREGQPIEPRGRSASAR